jgi:hypothetical protein
VNDATIDNRRRRIEEGAVIPMISYAQERKWLRMSGRVAQSEQEKILPLTLIEGAPVMINISLAFLSKFERITFPDNTSGKVTPMTGNALSLRSSKAQKCHGCSSGRWT